jgi:hypothetical protein
LKVSTKIYCFYGAVLQCKNRKNFIKRCCHKDDFGVGAEWHFFATSYGKVACDEIRRNICEASKKGKSAKPL